MFFLSSDPHVFYHLNESIVHRREQNEQNIRVCTKFI